MALPLLTTPDDVRAIVEFLSRRPSGVNLQDARAILGDRLVDRRKVGTLQQLCIVAREDGRLRLTPQVGRSLARVQDREEEFARILGEALAGIPAYRACLEWSYQQRLEALTVSEVGAFWHDHFHDDLATENEREISFRATCFLQLAAGSRLGIFVPGRRGLSSRLELDREALEAFVHTERFDNPSLQDESSDPSTMPPTPTACVSGNGSGTGQPTPDRTSAQDSESRNRTDVLGQAIFIGHGKNKTPLAQLKRILDQFKIPYKVVVDEPQLGRPISEKLRQTMRECNCAILIFSADEEFFDKDGKSIWRPSQNVLHELGAAGLLYGQRIVILKESRVDLATNFRDLGYIDFDADNLDAKSIDVLKELIGFQIVKVST